MKTFGRLDILVNNAAVARGKGLRDLTETDWQQSLAVNLGGTAAMMHWAAKHWQEQGPQAGRCVVNTSSPVVVPPISTGAAYVASKAAIVALTMATAVELAELGVRVNVIAPVGRTRLSEAMAPDLMKPVTNGFDRMAPENVSALVVYLASPRNRVTGRLLGIVGDQLFVYDGITAAYTFSNEAKQWSADALQAAFDTVPLQQKVKGLGGRGPVEQPFPSDLTFQALKRVEGSAQA